MKRLVRWEPDKYWVVNNLKWHFVEERNNKSRIEDNYEANTIFIKSCKVNDGGSSFPQV